MMPGGGCRKGFLGEGLSKTQDIGCLHFFKVFCFFVIFVFADGAGLL